RKPACPGSQSAQRRRGRADPPLRLPPARAIRRVPLSSASCILQFSDKTSKYSVTSCPRTGDGPQIRDGPYIRSVPRSTPRDAIGHARIAQETVQMRRDPLTWLSILAPILLVASVAPHAQAPAS